MQNPLRSPRWSPYVVGAGIGVLSWCTFLFMDQALGTSTTMVRAAGVLEGLAAPGELGKQTAVTATGLAPWWFLALLALAAVLGFGWLERRERRGTVQPGPRTGSLTGGVR